MNMTLSRGSMPKLRQTASREALAPWIAWRFWLVVVSTQPLTQINCLGVQAVKGSGLPQCTGLCLRRPPARCTRGGPLSSGRLHPIGTPRAANGSSSGGANGAWSRQHPRRVASRPCRNRTLPSSTRQHRQHRLRRGVTSTGGVGQWSPASFVSGKTHICPMVGSPSSAPFRVRPYSVTCARQLRSGTRARSLAWQG